MKKPDAALELEFNKAGLYFYQKESFYDNDRAQPRIGVRVEVGLLPEAEPLVIDFLTVVKSRRGIVTNVSDWKVDTREDQKILSFILWQRIPDGHHDDAPDVVTPWFSTGFMNLCYWSGNQEMVEDFKYDLFTKPDPSVPPGDLGWQLPSRFVDSMIDALGKINDFMLSGTLEDGIIYGPLMRGKHE